MVNKKTWFERNKKYVYISTGAMMIMALSFVITLNIFSMENEVTKEIPENKFIAQSDDKLQTDDSSIRMKEENIAKVEEKIVEKEIVEKKTAETPKVDVTKIEEKSVPVSTTPAKKEITFELPLEGNIIMEFAPEKLIYSETLEEWITHNGVDIKGEEAMPVKAVSDGTIKSIKVDPRYGNTIIIQHDDGYESRYSNLSTTDLVKLKQEVKKGDIISGVGKGYGFEIDEGPHIHVELLKDGKYLSILDLI